MIGTCAAGRPIVAREYPVMIRTAANRLLGGATVASPAISARFSSAKDLGIERCFVAKSPARAITCDGRKMLADQLRLHRLEEGGLSYKETFIVRCYEVGIHKTATIMTIANLLQEVACNHILSMGFSIDGFGTTNTMRRLRLVWVTSRMHIEILKYPVWGDVVEIETWIQDRRGNDIRRDWVIKDLATGSVIGRATSNWVTMNQDTRKLQRITNELREEWIPFCSPNTGFAFAWENNERLDKIPKIKDSANFCPPQLVAKLQPRIADLDMNHHVNHVTYIRWVLESMPRETIDSHELQTITLHYRRECQEGDFVDSVTSLESNGCLQIESTNGFHSKEQQRSHHLQFLHGLRLSNTGLEVNRARTTWRKLIPTITARFDPE